MIGETQRLLNNNEQAYFQLRHPIVATWINETLALQAAGLYNYDYNPAEDWLLPGVIPPWGVQVEDSTFGYVVLFPARDRTIKYSGWTAYNAEINKPGYESPGPTFEEFLEDIGETAQSGLNTILFAGVIVLGAFWIMNKKGY